MKHLFIVFSIIVMTVSCINDDTGYQRTYTPVATFEYTFDYNAEFGADSLCFNKVENAAGFGFDVFGFQHKLNPSKTDVEGGFILSYLANPKVFEVTDTLLNNHYRAYDIKYKDKNTYAVYKLNPDPSLMPEHDIQFTMTSYGACMMQGCYVTNTVETAKALYEKFEKGDKLVLKATGYLNGQSTGSASISLAEFSSQKDSVVCTWTPFNLTALGNVEFVDFELISDKPGIPAAFCVDNVIAKVELEY